MIVRTFVTLATLTVSLTTPIARAAPPDPGHRHAERADPAPRPHLRADELYAPRARRRFAAYMRLRLLELREAGLERAAAVVERRLPVQALVPPVRELKP